MEQLVQDIPATSFDALLVKSCRIYGEIDRIYDFLHKDLSRTSSIQLSASMEELECLVREAQTIDGLMKDILKHSDTLSNNTKELLQKRRDIIAVLQLKNRKIAQGAANIKSHLRHELSKFGRNRAALKGYKPAMNGKKCLINTTS